MIQVKCIQKFRDKNNQIYGYRLIDVNGQTKDVQPNNLKQAIANKQIHVVNLTLTSDWRLVDTSEKQLQNKKILGKESVVKTDVQKKLDIIYRIFKYRSESTLNEFKNVLENKLFRDIFMDIEANLENEDEVFFCIDNESCTLKNGIKVVYNVFLHKAIDGVATMISTQNDINCSENCGNNYLELNIVVKNHIELIGAIKKYIQKMHELSIEKLISSLGIDNDINDEIDNINESISRLIKYNKSDLETIQKYYDSEENDEGSLRISEFICDEGEDTYEDIIELDDISAFFNDSLSIDYNNIIFNDGEVNISFSFDGVNYEIYEPDALIDKIDELSTEIEKSSEIINDTIIQIENNISISENTMQKSTENIVEMIKSFSKSDIKAKVARDEYEDDYDYETDPDGFYSDDYNDDTYEDDTENEVLIEKFGIKMINRTLVLKQNNLIIRMKLCGNIHSIDDEYFLELENRLESLDASKTLYIDTEALLNEKEIHKYISHSGNTIIINTSEDDRAVINNIKVKL